jgi:hypothetical protein
VKVKKVRKKLQKKVRLCFCPQKKANIKKVFINNFKAKDLEKK